MKRVCTACGLEKEIEEFQKSKSGKYGVSAECTLCLNLRSYASRRRRLLKQGKVPNRIPTLLARQNRANGVKYCPKCKQTKPLEAFYTAGKSNKGTASHCKECCKVLSETFREINPGKYKHHYKQNKRAIKNTCLLKKFGVTLDWYESKLLQQNSKCACCKLSVKHNGKRLAVDHNHITMQVRDLLCNNCNVAIGFLKEDINRCKQVLNYLQNGDKRLGYMHINNLYKDQTILMFKECFAMEKIHGTSAHIHWNDETVKQGLTFFSGGEKHERFVTLFNQEVLAPLFVELFTGKVVTIYGEAYGGKQQGMSETYGKELKFIAFDVCINNVWLSVENAKGLCDKLGIEFVHFVRVPTDIECLDAQRDHHSIQAVRNGVTTIEMVDGSPKVINPRIREGVVLRPIVEVTLNNGARVICKHKRDEFKETATSRKVIDPEQQKVLDDAGAVATEWVTVARLEHVLDKIPDHAMEKMPQILAAMEEDVMREGAGEIVDSPAVRKAIKSATARMYKEKLQNSLKRVVI